MRYGRERAVGTLLRGVAVSVTLLSLMGCGQHPDQDLLPKDVVGLWTTDDPRYQERVMELSRAFVIIITGRHDPASVQMIDRVESAPNGGETIYTIYSTDYSQGTHFEMKLQYSPANGGEIRFRKQSGVWKRRVEIQSKPAKSR